MDDSISRNAVINELNRLDVSDGIGISSIACSVQKSAIIAIQHLPSTDRRGKWINEGENSPPICSVCKSRALLNYESDYHKSDYCPHCGAKMEK